jgi:hypothetical protein
MVVSPMGAGSVRRRLLILAASTTLTMGCECENVPAREQASPDGQYVATVVERNCGATSDYLTAINVRSQADPFEGDSADDVFMMWGLPPLEISWSGARQLLVGVPTLRGKEKIYIREASWRDVTITYRWIERSNVVGH